MNVFIGEAPMFDVCDPVKNLQQNRKVAYLREMLFGIRDL